MREFTMMSLFDGSGGFPLAATLCGIRPVAASEVEPYPIAVTRSRFPHMKHLGDISKINGGEIEPVDIITFGSPCQDLSVAGKRAGLKHESNGDDETTRSGLFMEAVRIIKEMREKTNGRYPTFALWENVPGAFSSNKGEDFRVVLEELIKIVEPTCSVPPMPKGGWPYADAYMGDGWSLAYRVFDAQYWGVPQRRRRIHLVLDLRGERAGQVSFEREGVRGYFAEGRTPWQGIAGDAQDCVITANSGAGDSCEWQSLRCRGFSEVDGTERATGNRVGKSPDCGDGAGITPYTLKIRSGCEGGGKGALIQTDKSATLSTLNDQYLFQPICMATQQGGAEIRTDDKAPTVTAAAGMSGNNQPVVCYAAGFKAGQSKDGGIGYAEECSPTLSAQMSALEPTVCIKEQHLFENHSQDTRYRGPLEVSPIVSATFGMGGNNQPFVVEEFPIYCLQGNTVDRDAKQNGNGVCADAAHTLNAGINATGGHYIAEGGPAPSLRTEHPPGVCIRYIVRRLTPTECARLQGFADRWGDIDPKEDFTDEEYRFWLDVRNTHATVIGGKEAKDYTKAQMVTWYNRLLTDSAEYKMWGNGIALPPALYVMQGMEDALKGERHDESA